MHTRRLLLLGAVVLVGCGDILGLNGYTDQLDGSSLDGATDGSATDVTGDALKDGGCTSGFTCVAALPSGWTWAAYAPDMRPACATGYTTPTDVSEGIDAGAATCACGCATTNPTCNTGNITVTAGTNGACNNITNQTDTAAGGCNGPTSFTTKGGTSSIAVTGPTPSGGSCTPNPTESAPDAGFDHQGRTCTYTGAATACGAGNVCVPNPAPFSACVAQVGMNACPSGFPSQHVVGTTLADTRGCTACKCTFDAGTCGGTATFYRNGGCNFGATAIPVNGTCTAVGNHTWLGYTYAPMTNDTCAAATVSPDGGVTFSDLTTVCCN